MLALDSAPEISVKNLVVIMEQKGEEVIVYNLMYAKVSNVRTSALIHQRTQNIVRSTNAKSQAVVINHGNQKVIAGNLMPVEMPNV